jgi:Zn-finger nucleic acid-binding protein
MDRFTRSAAEGSSVMADMCARCGGVWLDGGEVAAVYPALAELPERLAGLGASSARTLSDLPACPRCQRRTVEFSFFDLRLDSCTACHGLWVDGDELIDLARSRDRRDGLRAPPPQRSGYRENAASLTRAGLVTCRGCGAELPVRATMMTAGGPRCAPCAERDASENGPGEGDAGEPTIPMRSFFSLGEGDGATGTEVLSFLGTFLGGLIDASGRCGTCGCSRRSRCHG